MPEVGVDRQRCQGIMKTAGIGKDRDSSEKGVAHEKRKDHPAQSFPADPGIGDQEIHRDTAELKRKIPPVILSAAKQKSQRKLFPDLAGEHDDAAQKKQPV